MTRDELCAWAQQNSDGCTGVADIYVESCWAHDYCYQTGTSPWTGKKVTKAQADALLRREIQRLSRFGVFSPVSWWRWVGVRLFGRGIWSKH